MIIFTQGTPGSGMSYQPITSVKFPDTPGYWFGAKDYQICNRPDVCKGCLQQHHLKLECHRLVTLRLFPSVLEVSPQLDLFGGAL